ncbi:MAG: FUN14 domain-containing protein [Deltaproteobacteria bacterium]|nr:FUN14 domain-containing protein [Deltaproteobacteria bacterium]
MDVSQLFGNLPVTQLGFGGMAGLVVGYTAKKIAKVAAILLGVLFLLIQILAYNGLITVNWGAVEHTATGVWSDGSGVTLADRAWAVISGNLPFGGAFVTGFLLGFKLG